MKINVKIITPENDLKIVFAIRKKVFVEEQKVPEDIEWDEAKQFPKELYGKLAKAGLLGLCAGSPWPTEYLGEEIAGGTI